MHQTTTLRVDRTVDRGLVHRSAVSEVYLTDATDLGTATYAVAVHVPAHHSYYADHADDRRVVDPLFLVETVRQAQSYLAHTRLGVPRDHRFVLRDVRVRVLRELLVEETTARAGEAAVVLVVDVVDPVRARGELRSATFRAQVVLRADGEETPVATVEIATSFVPAPSYALLRGEPTWRGAEHETGRGAVLDVGRRGVVEPPSVGRTWVENVVIASPEHAPARSTAVLSPPYTNAAMFDHAQDHVPGMVLLEAVRQLVVHRATARPGGGVRRGRPDGRDVTSFDAAFLAFAEHTPSARLVLEPAAPAGSAGPADLTHERYEATVVDGATAAVLARVLVGVTA